MTDFGGSRLWRIVRTGDRARLRRIALRLSATAAMVAVALSIASSVQLSPSTEVRAAVVQDCATFGVSGCDAQGTAGAAVYGNVCATCHGESLQGVDGPPLMGPRAAVADLRTGRRLFEYVSTQMPEDAPGSLSERQYLDVVAFLLAANGVHPGGAISQETLDSITLQ